PLHSINDVITAARANPGRFNVGTINPGSTQNLSAELLKAATGVNMTIVPYRSTPEVLTALLRDDIHIMIESYAALKAPIDDGRVRPIAATGETRSPMLPNVPTLRETGVAAEVVGWNALVAPAQPPRPIVELINRDVAPSAAQPDFRQRLIELGTEARASTPRSSARGSRPTSINGPSSSSRPASRRDNQTVDAREWGEHDRDAIG